MSENIPDDFDANEGYSFTEEKWAIVDKYLFDNELYSDQGSKDEPVTRINKYVPFGRSNKLKRSGTVATILHIEVDGEKGDISINVPNLLEKVVTDKSYGDIVPYEVSEFAKYVAASMPKYIDKKEL